MEGVSPLRELTPRVCGALPRGRMYIGAVEALQRGARISDDVPQAALQ